WMQRTTPPLKEPPSKLAARTVAWSRKLNSIPTCGMDNCLKRMRSVRVIRDRTSEAAAVLGVCGCEPTRRTIAPEGFSVLIHLSMVLILPGRTIGLMYYVLHDRRTPTRESLSPRLQDVLLLRVGGERTGRPSVQKTTTCAEYQTSSTCHQTQAR